MRAQGFALRPPALGKLAATGAMLGPACDAIHNQLLLTYDRFPVAIGDARTSLRRSQRPLRWQPSRRHPVLRADGTAEEEAPSG